MSERAGQRKATNSNVSENTVLVVGLGETGKPLLEIIAAKTHAQGIDIDSKKVTASVGIMHICYPYNADFFVQTAIDYVMEYGPDLTIVESTVMPGTTRAIYEKTGKPIAYSPIKGKHFRMKEDLLRYTKFVAGIDDESARLAVDHFKAIGMKARLFSSVEGLELAKLLCTTYFGLLVAWAQEVERFCKRFDADYEEVLSFTEEVDYLPPVIFQPGHIGGHCIMPNIKLLREMFNSDFLEAILDSNEKKAKELLAAGKSLTERISPRKIR